MILRRPLRPLPDEHYQSLKLMDSSSLSLCEERKGGSRCVLSGGHIDSDRLKGTV